MKNQHKKNDGNFSRRDILKGMATIPVLGALGGTAWGYHASHPAKPKTSHPPIPDLKQSALNQLTKSVAPGSKIRIGLIGNGNRGMQLLRALGYADNEWVDKNTENGRYNRNVQLFLEQADLNLEIAAICDTFQIYAERGANVIVNGLNKAQTSLQPKIYTRYQDMLADDLIDAVVIATPDHWHARMIIDAARAGKHVYCEKPMTRTVTEAFEVLDAVRKSGIIFQLGHQNRQQASYIKAREVVENDLLGPVSLVETYTNRNNDHGAWIRGIHPEANSGNIDWEGFLGDAPAESFDLDRYFNWQKWFEYSGGPAGNQFTHEYDCINQVLGLGIPTSVTALGGNYYFKDPRNIPDVFNAIFNYEDRGLTLTYDCSLKSSYKRDKLILGQDAAMVLSINLGVFPDRQSPKYQEYNIDPDVPLFSYNPQQDEVDAN
ncbi:MAG: Gfo/Idh/MocA family protein, partial [Candidatus Cyclobacteriaceae bacterium M3_2C_046]